MSERASTGPPPNCSGPAKDAVPTNSPWVRSISPPGIGKSVAVNIVKIDNQTTIDRRSLHRQNFPYAVSIGAYHVRGFTPPVLPGRTAGNAGDKVTN